MIRQTTLACLAAIAVQAGVASAQPVQPVPVPGKNVNLVSGPAELNLAVSPPIIRGDILLKQQNEGSCAMSSRNPKNILCGGNDYRLVDLPGVDPESVTRDAWGGVYQSANGGDTWESTVHPGSFLDPAPSVLKSYRAMADVTVRSGAAGLAYYSALTFNAINNSSIIFISTWLDLNNKEDERMPFKMVRPVLVVDSGPVHQFMDKPWTFVSAPENTATCQINVPRPDGTVVTQTIPDSPLYIGYTIFVGNQPNQDLIRTKMMIAKVTDCGARVSQPVKVSEGQAINQGFAIAKSLSPWSNRLVGAWRRVDNGHESNAILAAVSDNGGGTWSKPMIVAAPICPFEQGSTATSARINTFPAITADETGRFYVAWSDRGKGASGACLTGARSRIVISSSVNGTTWTTPAVVDPGANDAHQITPSLTYGGGTLHLLWKDLRESASKYFDAYVNEWPLLQYAAGALPPPPTPPDPPVPPVRHHTVDVWSRMASPNGANPLWGPSVRVSQYTFGVSGLETQPSQKQWNIINLRLFAKGKKAFDGDYLDSTTPPLLPPDPKAGRTSWTYDLGQGGDPVFFGVWTDNRDVRRHLAQADPTGTVPVLYTPPGGGGTSIYDPTQPRPVCVPGTGDYTGTMNQNLYGARIDRGLFAYSPGNNKPVTDFPRAYVVIVRNDSDQSKTFELSIPAAYQPPGGTASFTEVLPFSSELSVQVPARSSSSRSVFIVPDTNPATTLDPKTTVRVDVTEVGSGAPLDTSVYINPDPTAPEIEAPEIEAPEIEAVEVYTPEIEAASISTILNSSVPSPEIEAPEIEAPEIEAPEIEANSFQTPEIEAPEIEAPEIEAPEIEAPEIEANAITDITWPIQNTGNTVAGYAVRPTVAGDLSNFGFQFIISRVVLIPTASNCNPAQATTSKVAVMIKDAKNLVDPDAVISPEDLEHATIWIAPGERVLVTLRVRGETAFDPVTHPTVVTVGQQAIDTLDYQAGETEPPTFTGGSVLLAVATAALSNGIVGSPYDATLTATGGVAPYDWSLASGALPPGLTLNASGTIVGTPTAVGTYAFAVQVADSGSSMQSATADFTIVIGKEEYYIVTDGGGSIFRVAPDGTTDVVASVTGGSPDSIAAEASGSFVVADPGAHRVLRITPGTVQTVYTGSPLVNPVGIGVDAAGDIIVGDNDTDKIYKLAPDGSSIVELAALPASPELQDIRMALDSGGDLIVSDDANSEVTLLRITPAGTTTTILHTATIHRAGGVAIDASGNIIVGDFSQQKIFTVTPGGTIVGSLPVTPVGINMVGLGISSNGDYVVAVNFANAIMRATTSGSVTTVKSGAPLTYPTDLLVYRPASTMIDFESPSLGANDRQLIDPYVAGGITFTAEPGGLVGLVKNQATSACVPPASANQTLGTTPSSDPNSVGFSGFAIRATFSSAIPVGSTVSVAVETAGGQTARLRLFDSEGALVGTGTGLVPSVGVCLGYPGDPRGTVTVSATATSQVAYAIVDIAAGTGGYVFVLDNFTIR